LLDTAVTLNFPSAGLRGLHATASWLTVFLFSLRIFD